MYPRTVRLAACLCVTAAVTSIAQAGGYGFLPPDVRIAKSHAGNFAQGQVGAQYSIVVSSAACALPVICWDISSTVTVVDLLPPELTATSIAGTGWSCALATLTCVRSDRLSAGYSYPPILVTVNVSASAPAQVVNSATVSAVGENPSATGNNTAVDVTSIAAAPDLAIAKTHAGPFVQGQTGASYRIVVSNAGAGATSGTVTVVDNLPEGLTATAMAGTGWSCTLATLACTRADVLGAGMSYPTIALTVNVSPMAPATVVNVATVSGSTAGTTHSTASDMTVIAGAAFPPEAIPSSSRWTLLLLASLLAFAGSMAIRSR